MPIRIQCIVCESVFNVPDSAAGRKVRCKNCQGPIPVPVPVTEPQVPKAAEPLELVAVVANEEPKQESEITAAEAKEAKRKAKREAKARQSRRALVGCFFIFLGLLFVGAVVAAYFLYYPLMDRGVPYANYFREYKRTASKLEGETDADAKLKLQSKQLAILMAFEQVQWTDESKAKFKKHFEGDWPKHGERLEQIWDYQVKYKLQQDKKNNPEKHTPLVPWEAKPDPGFAFVLPEELPKPLNLSMNANVVYPAVPSAFALVQTGTAAKSIRAVIELGTLKLVTVTNLPEDMTPMQLSDDGKWVACQRADGTARKTIVEAGTGKKVLEVGSISDQTLHYSFLPNGRYLTLEKSGYGQDYEIEFTIHTLVDKGKRSFKLPQLTPIALSPGGRYLACVWHNTRRITLVDLEDGKSKGDIQYADRNKVESGIRIAFSTDGKLLAAVFGSESRAKFGVWSMETGAEITPQFEPSQSLNRFGSMTHPLYIQWLPDNSGLLAAQRLIINLKGQSLGELPALDPQKPFPRRVIGGNLYTDDRVGGLNRAGKLTLERLPTQ